MEVIEYSASRRAAFCFVNFASRKGVVGMKNGLGDAVLFFLPFAASGFFLIKNRKLGSLAVLLGYALAVAQAVCAAVLNRDLDYFVFMRLDWDMLRMAPSVMAASSAVFIAITALVLLAVWLNWTGRLRRVFTPKRRFLRLGLLALCALTIVFSPVTSVYWEMLKSWRHYARASSCSEAELFAALGARRKPVAEADVAAEAGRNIVVVYCESLENNFLNREDFPDSLPRLHRLIDAGWSSWSDYRCVSGATWTIGALYATQTSFPAFFGGAGDELFDRLRSSRLTSYTKVMRRAGYDCLFLAGCELGFGGTGSLMKMLGYRVKGFRDFEKGCEKTVWGAHDADLFEQAKLEYSRLAAAGRPFNLTLLTVDTHFTKGLPDARLKDKVSPAVPPMSHEYCMACLDYLLGDFVDFVAAQLGGRETAIVILGDHLMMGSENNTPILGRLKKRPRTVALLTNRRAAGWDPRGEIGFYNVPRLILDLAGIKHNALFLDGLVPNLSPRTIEAHSAELTALNLRLTVGDAAEPKAENDIN